MGFLPRAAPSRTTDLGFDDLLVPTDGSDHADAAVSYVLSTLDDLREEREAAEGIAADAAKRVEAAGSTAS